MALTIDLENKKAFVSGATRGIGAGVARALAMAGCDVAGCGNDWPIRGRSGLSFRGSVRSFECCLE